MVVVVVVEITGFGRGGSGGGVHSRDVTHNYTEKLFCNDDQVGASDWTSVT